MNKEQLLHFENLFLDLKKQTISEMKFEDENITPISSGDDVDQSLEERDRALKLKLIGRHSFMLKKIDGALAKIKNGTYGICEECEGEIDTNRLNARPVATHCIGCKEEQERTEGQMQYENRSHTSGKGFNSNVIPLHRQDVMTPKLAVMSVENL